MMMDLTTKAADQWPVAIAAVISAQECLKKKKQGHQKIEDPIAT